MKRHSAIHASLVDEDEEKEQRFQNWRAELDAEKRTAREAELRAIFQMDTELKEVEAVFEEQDTDDWGRCLHAFFLTWKNLLPTHETYLARYTALRKKLEGASAGE